MCAVCGEKRPLSLSPGGFSSLFSSPKKDPAAKRSPSPASAAAVTLPSAPGGAPLSASSSPTDTKISAPYVYRGFLDDTAGQFTHYGFEQLQRSVEEKELCVFFRNNHFSVLTKLRGKLYSLITDEGFANHVNVVWESLEGVRHTTLYSKLRLYSAGLWSLIDCLLPNVPSYLPLLIGTW
jgi:hypothetical protein